MRLFLVVSSILILVIASDAIGAGPRDGLRVKVLNTPLPVSVENPTTTVTIDNSESDPVPVSLGDTPVPVDPGSREPYFLRGDFDPEDDGFTDLILFTPDDATVVIRDASSLVVHNPEAIVNISLFITTSEGPISHMLGAPYVSKSGGNNASNFGRHMDLILPPGTRIRASMASFRSDGTPIRSGFSTLSLSGHIAR